ncbi:MAG: SBBP repeat-containing protein [candidate division WOR-3 bacterium]
MQSRKWCGLLIAIGSAVLQPALHPGYYVFAQVWVRTYDGPANGMDNCYSLALDSSGCLLLTGYVTLVDQGETVPAYCTMKYTGSGERQWVKFFPRGFGLTITADSEGNAIVAGDSFVLKYSSEGEQLWVRHCGPAFWGSDVAVDTRRNVYVTGYYLDTRYAITIKYDANGNEEWIRVDSAGNWFVSMAVDSLNNVYCGGYSYADGRWAYRIVKYKSSGEREWGISEELLNGVINKVRLSDCSDLYVVGSLLNESGPYAAATVKYDSNGVRQWVRFFEGPGYDVGQTLAVDRNGNCYVAIGTAERPGMVTNFDIVLVKYAADGTEIWQRRYTGYGGDDYPFAIGVDAQKNIYVCGYSDSRRSDTVLRSDYLLLKYDSLGNLQWEARYYEGENWGWAYDLEIDPTESCVYTAGYVTKKKNGCFDYDWCTIKYLASGPGITENEPVVNSTPIMVVSNPARSCFRIRSRLGLSSLGFYDITGRLIMSYPVRGQVDLTCYLIGVCPGVYLIKGVTAEGVLTSKLIVR